MADLTFSLTFPGASGPSIPHKTNMSRARASARSLNAVAFIPTLPISRAKILLKKFVLLFHKDRREVLGVSAIAVAPLLCRRYIGLGAIPSCARGCLRYVAGFDREMMTGRRN